MEDYPHNLLELEERFATEDACVEYLKSLRWPDGFRCPRCSGDKAWPLKTGLLRCSACDYKALATAGTIFERTRKPLVMWFRAIWWVTSQKNGASATTVQRILELGSYQTAWAWLHKLRRAMVRPGRDQLSGVVEVDETYVGGPKPGKRGRGAAGKSIVMVAVQQKTDEGIGRIRLGVVPDISRKSLIPFVAEVAVPGSTIRTDEWRGYARLPRNGYGHIIVPTHELQNAHLVISLFKRWLGGTHQGAVSHEHLAYYLDEYTFRFNRRTSAHRGKLFYRLLQNAMEVEPVTYRQMVKGIRGRKPGEPHM